jgi:hypothetical protein
MNNPLNTTDPSGFSWLSKAFHRLGNWIRGNWRSIVSIVVVAVLTWGLGTFTALGAYSSGAISGGVSGGLNAGLNGGDFNDILRGTVVQGAQGAIAAGFLHGLGESAKAAGTFSVETAVHVAGHGVLGGASNAALGGKFQDGFLSAATSTFAADAGLLGAEGGGAVGIASRTIRASIIGGSASALGGGKFANGAYTAAFQHLLNFEFPKTAIGAGLKWFGAGFKDAWVVTEKDSMGQDLLRFPEVKKAIDELNASTDPNAVIQWNRELGLLGPTPIRTYIFSFAADFTGASIFSEQNLTRALVGSIHGGRVYRDSSGYVNVSASDTLSIQSAFHLPPWKGSYGASIPWVKNDMNGWNGIGGNVKLEFNVRVYMPK